MDPYGDITEGRGEKRRPPLCLSPQFSASFEKQGAYLKFDIAAPGCMVGVGEEGYLVGGGWGLALVSLIGRRHRDAHWTGEEKRS